MFCTSKIHPFSLGNYLGTSVTFGNLMRIRVTSAERRHGQGQSGLPPRTSLHVMHPRCLDFLLQNPPCFGVNEIIRFQNLVENLEKMTVANLGRRHERSLETPISRVLENICIRSEFEVVISYHPYRWNSSYLNFNLIILLIISHSLDNTTTLREDDDTTSSIIRQLLGASQTCHTKEREQSLEGKGRKRKGKK